MQFIINEYQIAREALIKEHLMELNKDNDTIAVKVSDSDVYVSVDAGFESGVIRIDREKIHNVNIETGNLCGDEIIIEYQLGDYIFKIRLIGSKEIQFIGHE